MIAWFIARPMFSLVSGCVATVIALALVVALGFQYGKTAAALQTASAATKRADKSDADLKTCQGNVATLEDSIGIANAAVDRMAAERDAAQSIGRRALDEARKASRQTDREIARALNMQPKSADVCEQAVELETFLRGAQ